MGENVLWGGDGTSRAGAGGVATAGVDTAAISQLLGWQADTEIKLREAIFFEPQRIVADEVLRCVFTRTTVDSDYLQWSRTNNRFSLFIDAVENTRFSGNDLLVAGYLRVGSLTAPTNVTDGDLTAVRIVIGDSALAADSLFHVGAALMRINTSGSIFYNGTLTTPDTFYLGQNAVTEPILNFDANDFMGYIRGTNTFRVVIGSTTEFQVTASGIYANAIFEVIGGGTMMSFLTGDYPTTNIAFAGRISSLLTLPTSITAANGDYVAEFMGASGTVSTFEAATTMSAVSSLLRPTFSAAVVGEVVVDEVSAAINGLSSTAGQNWTGGARGIYAHIEFSGSGNTRTVDHAYAVLGDIGYTLTPTNGYTVTNAASGFFRVPSTAGGNVTYTNGPWAIFCEGRLGFGTAIPTENAAILAAGSILSASYARIGSMTVPTNTTAGDLTAIRLFVGDAAVVTNVEALITGDAAISGSLMVGASVDPTGTGLQVRGATTESALSVDSLRLGVLSGTPRIVFEDAASSTLWEIDNSAGVLRFFNPGATRMQIQTDGFLYTGYLRVGSLTAPTNVTAGDLTTIRACFGTDTAFNTSGLVELNSTTAALIVSRMTTGQRDAMTPVNGMIIYNTTTATLQGYQGGAWTNL